MLLEYVLQERSGKIKLTTYSQWRFNLEVDFGMPFNSSDSLLEEPSGWAAWPQLIGLEAATELN